MHCCHYQSPTLSMLSVRTNFIWTVQACALVGERHTLDWEFISEVWSTLGIKCLICKGKHFNLVQCKQLRNFIPYEGAVTKLPECVCLRCLSTPHSDGTRCTHVSLRPDWKQMICKVSDVHYIICRSCPEHKILQGYWRSRHDPAVDGLKGYDRIKQWFSDAVVHAGMHGSAPVRKCGRMSQA